jgi:hypothetical protein
MFVGMHVKYPFVLSELNKTWVFDDRFSQNTQISNFMKIRPVGTELFHAEGRTDGRTDREMDEWIGEQT